MLISHEAPLCIMKQVRAFTDYDYCLIHLLDNPEYLHFFEQSKKMGRYIIMDCSLFELGTAFNSDVYYEGLLRIQPDEYIIPDVWENMSDNLDSMESFMRQYDLSKLKGKSIGVLQGKTFTDFVTCYAEMAQYVDKIAVSFGYSYYTKNYTNHHSYNTSTAQGLLLDSIEWVKKLSSTTNSRLLDDFNKDIVVTFRKEVEEPAAMAAGRVSLIKDLVAGKIIDGVVPIHLLGCGLPWEFAEHKRAGHSFIESLDTSHPVAAGMYNRPYGDGGTLNKKRVKMMVEEYQKNLTEEQEYLALENIRLFRDLYR